MKVDFARNTAMVRQHLNAQGSYEPPPDQPFRPGTIQHTADKYGFTVEELDRFKLGDDTAIPQTTQTMFAQLLGGESYVAYGDSESDPNAFYLDYHSMAEDVRQKRFDVHDVIESTRTEASRALDIWADMAAVGSPLSDLRAGSFIPQPIKANTSLSNVLGRIKDRIDTTLLPDNSKKMVIRDMCKHGSEFEEIEIDRFGDGVHISALHPRRVRRIKYLQNPTLNATYGEFNYGGTNPVAEFPAWKLVHFANRVSRTDRYGRSIFDSCLRTWVQIEALETSMIIRRLERQSMRYLWKVDLAGCSTEQERQNRIRFYRDLYKKVKIVDSYGNIGTQKISQPSNEDLFLGLGPNAKDDVTALAGDTTLGEIADFLHFWAKWLAGLGPPKHYLGYEQDTMRSVGTDLTVVFARMARRMQLSFTQGLNHLYWIEMLLAGIDPMRSRYIIIPPNMGTRDDVMRAQILQAQAAAVKALSDAFSHSSKMPSMAWFLRYIMLMEDEAIADLAGDNTVDVVNGKDMGGDKVNDPKVSVGEADKARATVMADENAAAEIAYARHLINEYRMSKMNAEQLTSRGILALGDQMPTFDIRQAVGHLGIRDLREAA